MRKQIIGRPDTAAPASLWEEGWLHLDEHARVEVTSEAPEYPIENALLPGRKGGWLAAEPGTQTVRLVFDEPQTIQRIQLAFEERERARTQELFLGWAKARDQEPREIVRQQWTFAPAGSTGESEDYRVDLAGVGVLELVIVPDISHGDARASLARLRVG